MEEVKICQECHRGVYVKTAKFCPFCGANLRNKKEKVIFDATKAAQGGNIDQMRTAIAKLIAFIEAGVEDFE